MNLRRSITKRVLRRAARRGSFGQLDFGLLGVLGYDGFEAAPAVRPADFTLGPDRRRDELKVRLTPYIQLPADTEDGSWDLHGALHMS